MSRPVSSGLARSSPLATVRRDHVAVDPLDSSAPPTATLNTPHQQRQPVSPKGNADSAAPFQRLLLPGEILDIETKSFMEQCRFVLCVEKINELNQYPHFYRKQPITAQSVTQDFNGLIVLAQSFFWPSVLKLSSKLLEQENTPEHLLSSIMRIRFEALYRMKLYDELANEVTAILVEEEKKMEHDGDDQQGSSFNYNVVVSMRLVLNDIKLMTGRSEEAVEQLNAIKTWLTATANATTSESSNSSSNGGNNSIVLFWLWQVKCHIVSGYIRLRNWKSASLELNAMLNELQQRVAVCTVAEDRTNLLKGQITLLTRLARMLFQVRPSGCINLFIFITLHGDSVHFVLVPTVDLVHFFHFRVVIAFIRQRRELSSLYRSAR